MLIRTGVLALVVAGTAACAGGDRADTSGVSGVTSMSTSGLAAELADEVVVDCAEVVDGFVVPDRLAGCTTGTGVGLVMHWMGTLDCVDGRRAVRSTGNEPWTGWGHWGGTWVPGGDTGWTACAWGARTTTTTATTMTTTPATTTTTEPEAFPEALTGQRWVAQRVGGEWLVGLGLYEPLVTFADDGTFLVEDRRCGRYEGTWWPVGDSVVRVESAAFVPLSCGGESINLAIVGDVLRGDLEWSILDSFHLSVRKMSTGDGMGPHLQLVHATIVPQAPVVPATDSPWPEFPETMLGVEWQVTAVEVVGVPVERPEGAEASVVFQPDGLLSGHLGCNLLETGFTGTREEPESIGVAVTEMGCVVQDWYEVADVLQGGYDGGFTFSDDAARGTVLLTTAIGAVHLRDPATQSVSGAPACTGDSGRLEELLRSVADSPYLYSGHPFVPPYLATLARAGYWSIQPATVTGVRPVVAEPHWDPVYGEVSDATGNVMRWWGHEVTVSIDGEEAVVEVPYNMAGEGEGVWQEGYVEDNPLDDLVGACTAVMTRRESGGFEFLAVAAGPDEPPVPFTDQFIRVVDTGVTFAEFVGAADAAVRRAHEIAEACGDQADATPDAAPETAVDELDGLLRPFLDVMGVDDFALHSASDYLSGVTGAGGPYLVVGHDLTTEGRDLLQAVAPCMTVVPLLGEDRPSQSPADAERDGVLGELALYPYRFRVGAGTGVPAEEGVWVLSSVSGSIPSVYRGDRFNVGNTSGTWPFDYITRFMYGEVLLTDGAGRILRAWPMPGLAPRWLHLTPETVYVGNVSDGCIMGAALVRIDRATLDADLVAIPTHGGDLRRRVLPNWHVAPDGMVDDYWSVFGQAGYTDVEGTEVGAGMIADIEGIDRFIDDVIVASGRHEAAGNC